MLVDVSAALFHRQYTMTDEKNKLLRDGDAALFPSTVPSGEQNDVDDWLRNRQSCIAGAGWMNRKTGETIPFRCGSWKCEYCGPKKEQRLFAALKDLCTRWGYVRLWTFTLRHRAGETPTEHRKRLSHCWHQLVGRWRGRRGRGGACPTLEYVRVTELHPGDGWQHGYRHYHALVSQYVDARVMIALWKSVTGGEGSAHVKGIRSVEKAVRYICKYALKGATHEMREKNEPMYTRSHGIILYKKQESTGMWVVYFPWKLPCLEEASETLLHEVAAGTPFSTTPEGADPPDWDHPDIAELFPMEVQVSDRTFSALMNALLE